MSDRAAEILVVEDDADVREAIVEVLEEEGYAVGQAVHGAEALEILRRSEVLPRLILLDLMMPVLDGQGFCRERDKVPEWAAIPLVVLSADGRVGQLSSCLSAVAAVRKPVPLADLVSLAERWCR